MADTPPTADHPTILQQIFLKETEDPLLWAQRTKEPQPTPPERKGDSEDSAEVQERDILQYIARPLTSHQPLLRHILK